MPWHTIINGTTPDANEVQENFEYLTQQRDTFSNLQAVAATNPTIMFTCFATDRNLSYHYCGDVTIGDFGFNAIGGVTW